MTALGRIADGITTHSKVVIAVMLVLTLGIGYGATDVTSTSSLDAFESDSPEASAQTYISENFSVGDQDTQTVQVIVRNEDGNVLTKESLLRSLAFQQTLRDDAAVDGTLTENQSIVGVSNVVAITALQQDDLAEIRAQGAELQERQRRLEADSEQLQEDQAALERRSQALNTTAGQLRSALDTIRQDPDASVRTQFETVQANAPVELNESHYAVFEQAASDLRDATTADEVEAAYQLGTQGVLQEEFAALQQQSQELQQRAAELQERGSELEADFAAFQERRAALQNAPTPTLSEQRAAIESLNQSEYESVLTTVLSEGDENGDGSPFAGQALRLMENRYEPGSTTAEARMMVVQQVSLSNSDLGGGSAIDENVRDAQLTMQDYAQSVDADGDYIVFGFGIISHEIDQSMTDSLAIVGPLAVLFVLLTLAVAYRDVLDIVLGLFGIGVVLTWTFGFMGWRDIAFNQIMIAVPVLLIGLSIDYAIHIFMRHREERLDGATPSDVRGSMRYALAGVGIALVWVTATTVIGFLSNLTSPLGPIADFGIVSSFGIVAALVVFGAFVPALKVEADGAMEYYLGWNRKKRAFGTGGGRFSEVLAVGATLAKKAPVLVVLVALVLSGLGAVGATQVDTSFSNEDFIADEPADWMYDLPEQVRPGEYNAKSHLDYVSERFQRDDSQAQVLVEGGVTDPATLQALHEQQTAIDEGEYDSPFVDATGEVAYRSPLTVMESVAAQNESFNRTYQASLGEDGVPQENVSAVYDHLFEVAPDQAAGVVYRTDDGGYEAVRLVVPMGDATTAEQTEDVRAVATAIEDGGGAESVTATGTPVVNEVVQTQLLDTVIQSLIITLVAVFAFLMFAYRITEGSATLGIVTLLPVALSVTWILGTMYLIGMPFNVLTGMITSLTVGLGVAYSIHVSERFNLELGRRETKWEAMETTITGTGGALLGSAATTVGGFGVLSFAIFPALQQFGVITALTIVYAFLASVLVLPSLLVVWHRYVGSDDVATVDPDHDDEGDRMDGFPAANGGTEAQAGSIDADDGDVEVVGDDAAAEAEVVEPPQVDVDKAESTDYDPFGAADAAPIDGPTATTTTADEQGLPDATRTVSTERPEPGTRFQVSLSVDDADGRVLLTETVPGTGGQVTSLSPSPTSHAMVGRRLYVLWDLDEPTDVGLTYVSTVADDATGGDSLSFDATVRTPAGETTFDGPEGLTVGTQFLRETLKGPVTQATLDRASHLAMAGELTQGELESLYERWLDGDDADRR
ncbi:MMPL family transporter [Haloarchaeobius sp. HRN-SO-5]|uniref:efflux RND transporter permease subunit n=1 Tax=Haloarchaeobius sp. HRN-SO-5 TaxID=3446118 RepID=UPI003EBA1906